MMVKMVKMEVRQVVVVGLFRTRGLNPAMQRVEFQRVEGYDGGEIRGIEACV